MRIECGDPGAMERTAGAEEEAVNDFPSMNINTEELIAAVESLIEQAREHKGDLGAVNWGDLRIVDITYELSMLRPEDGPFCIVLVEEADPGCALVAWLNQRLDEEKFPGVYIECEW